ncbi:ELMO/CED-12 family-domain-containing protein [Zopfochytrium polystomum]|nr:ELMO/CED-12 family-domain-containing protein [Zopfochytrium polystomum]
MEQQQAQQHQQQHQQQMHQLHSPRGRKIRVSVVLVTSPGSAGSASGGGVGSVGHSQPVECNIDPSMSLADVTKDVALVMGVGRHWNQYSLRFANTNALLTEKSLRRGIKEGDVLKFGPSPARLTAQVVEDLISEDELAVKMTTFSLQKHIKEEEFVDEFLIRRGLERLQDLIVVAQGNTLAYALTSLQNLMEHDHGWDKFSPAFISTIVSIIVKQNLVNICRPATAILIKLVTADATAENSPIQCYGFDVVNAAVAAQSSFVPTLVQRLSATDYLLQLNSLHLINVLFRKATDRYRGEFVYLIDALNIRKVVVRLMQTRPPEELGKQLVEFQRLLIQEGHRRKRQAVDLRTPMHESMLREIWNASGLQSDGSVKWRFIGFESEVPRKELARVGVLGLETMYSFVNNHRDFFQLFIEDQLARPQDRVCPFAKACIEVVEILSDYWEVSTGYTITTSYQPLLLQFEEVYALTLKFFFMMWEDMDAQATIDDINRVASVVRSQFRHVNGQIQPGDVNCLATFERELMTTPYALIRERQLRELEVEDILMSRLPVRNLRERLYRNSYEFVRQQRIDCLMNGAWFPVVKEKGRAKGLYRFYRLGPNKKFLHWAEFVDTKDKSPALEVLSERIDMSTVTDILTGTSSPIFNLKKVMASENPALCFSLVSSVTDSNTSLSLSDFICATPTQYAEWTDGFNMLLDKNITNRETADYINDLTEIDVKLALLDLTGDGVDIPAVAPEIPDVPGNWNFYYDEEGGGLKEGIGGLASLAGAMMLGLASQGSNNRVSGGEDGYQLEDEEAEALPFGKET